MTYYAADLKLVASRFREPLRCFAEQGTPPTGDKVLLAVLIGQLAVAVKLLGEGQPNILANVLHFLDDHLPDFAWGSPENVVRWKEMKQQIARADKNVIAAVVPLLALAV